MTKLTIVSASKEVTRKKKNMYTPSAKWRRFGGGGGVGAKCLYDINVIKNFKNAFKSYNFSFISLKIQVTVYMRIAHFLKFFITFFII